MYKLQRKLFGRLIASIYILAASLFAFGVMAEEPALPSGLGIDSAPGLPSGLDALPTLPVELSSGSDDDWGDEEEPVWLFNGFWEARVGAWQKDQMFLPQLPLAESRVQLSAERAFEAITVSVSADLLYDNVVTESPDLASGRGWFDLRTANLVFSPQTFMDIRLGRQILTWGTGDLIFINDLFPKDWNSFLIGRDNAYLKAPSDAIKISLFSKTMNADIIYTPRFNSDRYISGERVSYYNSNLGRIAGTDALVSTEKPVQWFHDGELALRLYRNIATTEFALYAYHGFWKSPGGANPNTGNAIFPRLNVYGGSLRRPLFGGIVNGEWGYYHALDDTRGDNPLINNSELRLLLGYERELIANLTLAVQLYSTRMLGYEHYLQTLPSGSAKTRQSRHEISSRLTWMMLEQKLVASLFLRYSASDNDYYMRPKLRYSLDDHWSYEFGANIFYGDQNNTFFGQFARNNNAYAALRYGI